jgi:putative component of toxin-antitoxin plasmid stabilization module
MIEKPLIWLGDSRDTISAFPDDVRKIAGFQLWRVQRGLEPNDWKPMPSVGVGVQEIRIHTGPEHRVLYLAKFRLRPACLREADAADAERRPGSREAALARADRPAGAPEGIDHP